MVRKYQTPSQLPSKVSRVHPLWSKSTKHCHNNPAKCPEFVHYGQKVPNTITTMLPSVQSLSTMVRKYQTPSQQPSQVSRACPLWSKSTKHRHNNSHKCPEYVHYGQIIPNTITTTLPSVQSMSTMVKKYQTPSQQPSQVSRVHPLW